MTSSPQGRLAQLALACVDPPGVAELLRRVLPRVVDATDAVSALVLRSSNEALEDVEVVASSGAALPSEALPGDVLAAAAGWRELPLPDQWREDGVRTTRARWLTRSPEALLLVLAFDTDRLDDDLLDAAGALLQTAAGGAQTAASLTDMAHRVDNAQMLANMGDYDWHIASDTNRWSDQLYRIYGHEPQSFDMNYEKFISHVHPDDRDRITAIHQQAYASGEPYQMIERVQRPDGETRYLSSNGQVVLDDGGAPVRMRGTCIDITDLVMAEQAIERASARFEALVESSGDAIMVLDGGSVVQTNSRGRALLGGDPVGLPLERFVQVEGPESRGVAAHDIEGRPLVLDVFASELNPGVDDDLVAVFLRDAAPRLASESLAVSLREAQVRRRQAVEINDNILQSLTAAVYCLEDLDVTAAVDYIHHTLASARDMMRDLLEPVDGAELKPGDLVRRNAATLRSTVVRTPRSGETPTPTRPTPPATTDRSILVVDDSDDMRDLIGLFLEKKDGVRMVGSAATGHEGVRLAEQLQPDLVLLDLSMPDMDGLEALPHILTRSPGSQVIVLSGFDHRVADQALSLGAARFVQKGGGFKQLMRAIDETWPRGTPPQSAAS